MRGDIGFAKSHGELGGVQRPRTLAPVLLHWDAECLMRVIKGQPIGGTNVDSHGESYSVDFFRDLLDGAPQRVPMFFGHDPSEGSVGYMENMRIEPHPHCNGEWALVADIYYPEDVSPDSAVRTARGYSWSATSTMAQNSDHPQVAIYLPYPQYHDADLVRSLLADDEPLAVGRFIRKALNIEHVALITTVLFWAATPAWRRIYEDSVHPHVMRQWQRLKALVDSLSADHVIYFRGPDDDKCAIWLVPERGAEEQCYASHQIARILADVEVLVAREWRERRPVARVRAVFDPKRQRWEIFAVEYRDGSVVHQ